MYSVVLPPSLTVFLYCSLLVYRPPARSGRTLSQSTKTQVQSHPWSYQYDHTFIHPSIHVFTTFFSIFIVFMSKESHENTFSKLVGGGCKESSRIFTASPLRPIRWLIITSSAAGKKDKVSNSNDHIFNSS